MLKKGISLIILAAMIVHGAGRIGVLSYLYEKRQVIGYSIGVISEIPISICSADYQSDKKLQVDDSDADMKVPVSFHAQEINLFFEARVFDSSVPCITMTSRSFQFIPDNYELSSVDSVFHPPLV
jgi:hypothetical protein